MHLASVTNISNTIKRIASPCVWPLYRGSFASGIMPVFCSLTRKEVVSWNTNVSKYLVATALKESVVVRRMPKKVPSITLILIPADGEGARRVLGLTKGKRNARTSWFLLSLKERRNDDDSQPNPLGRYANMRQPFLLPLFLVAYAGT